MAERCRQQWQSAAASNQHAAQPGCSRSQTKAAAPAGLGVEVDEAGQDLGHNRLGLLLRQHLCRRGSGTSGKGMSGRGGGTGGCVRGGGRREAPDVGAGARVPQHNYPTACNQAEKEGAAAGQPELVSLAQQQLTSCSLVYASKSPPCREEGTACAAHEAGPGSASCSPLGRAAAGIMETLSLPASQLLQQQHGQVPTAGQPAPASCETAFQTPA